MLARRVVLLSRPWYAGKLTNPGIAIIGDSIPQLGVFADVNAVQINNTSASEISVAKSILGSFSHENWNNPADDRPAGFSSLRYFTGANFGVGADDAGETLARVVAGEIASVPMKVLVVAVGTNDVTASHSAATIFANIQSICEYALAKKIRVVLCTIRPRSTGPNGTAGTCVSPLAAADARWAILYAANALIRTYATTRQGVTLCDWFDDLRDPAPASGELGEVMAGYTRDGLHLAPLGAYYSGKRLATVLAPLLSSSLSFDDNPATSNSAPNGIFTGTAGTKDSNTAGDVVTSWTIARRAPTTNLGVTITGSTEADGANTKQVMTFDITDVASPNVTESWFFRPNPLNISRAAFADDVWMQSGIKLEINAWPLGWRSFTYELIFLDVSNAVVFTSRGFNNGTISQEHLTPEAGAFWIFTEPAKLTSTVTNMRLQFGIQCTAAGQTGQGILKVSRPLLRAVPDPHIRWPETPRP
jgi:lysophospholipase L1-like esterase